MTLQTKYLDIRLTQDTGKTQTYAVDSRLHGFPLGTIKWFGRWRQYVFFPEPETVFNNDCLVEIATFVGSCMTVRRQQMAAGKRER